MNAPCRVMADIAAHESSLRDAEQDFFDDADEMKVGAVVPYEMVKPILDLLAIRHAIKTTKREHFTEEEREKFFQVIREDLDKLYVACVDRYRDL